MKSYVNKSYYPWVVVALLWVVALLNYMDRQMLSTMQDAIKADIVELSVAQNFGRLMAIFLWIYGLMSPWAGFISDKLSKKWIIVGSLIIWSSVTFAMGLATSFNQMMVLRAFMGLSEAMYIPAGLSLIASYHSDKTRALAIGVHMTGLYLGQALGGFGANISESFSWQTTFQTFGLIGVLYGIILIIFLHDKKYDIAKIEEDKKEVKDNQLKGLAPFKIIFTNFYFWILLIYFVAPSLPGWATKSWLPTLFRDNLNLDMSIAGPVSTITIAVSSFFGVLLGGRLSDKWVKSNAKGRVYTSAIGTSLMVPSLILMGLGTSVYSVVFAAILFGWGLGMADANHMPILQQIIPAKFSSTAYGVLNMAGVFSGAMVTQVLGSMSDNGDLGLGFAVLAAFVIAAVILVLIYLKPKQQQNV